MNIEPDIERLIYSYSKSNNIDPDWVKAVITTESNWYIYAARYEVNYQYLVTPTKYVSSNNSLSTEIDLQKTSIGLGQIMGALAREQGHEGGLLELVRPEVNITHVCMRLGHLKSISNEAGDVFSMYNAGPEAYKKKIHGSYLNQGYVNKVNSNLALFAK